MSEGHFLIGTSGWSYNHWKGLFYPEKLPKKQWLGYYANQFKTVEVNATFYGWFKEKTIINWREQTPPGFWFVLKAPRLITHRRHLLDSDETIKEFERLTSFLEPKLSLILLQIAPDTPYDPPRLQHALSTFEDPTKVAVEFRSEQWEKPEIIKILKEIGAVYCNPDSPRKVLSGLLTSDIGYLRLHGRRRWYSYDYSGDELLQIADLGKDMIDQGAKQVFFFFNNDFGGFAPKNAATLAKILSE